jgi:hypothetical protein
MHGQRGEDPNEPSSNDPSSYPPVAHEPQIQAVDESLRGDGLHPFDLPLGVLLDEKDGRTTANSRAIRTPYFDGYPSAINRNSNGQVMYVDPSLAAYPHLTLDICASGKIVSPST